MTDFVKALQSLSIQRNLVASQAANLRMRMTKRKGITYAEYLGIKLQLVQTQLILEELNKVLRLELLNLNHRAANDVRVSEVVDFVGAWLQREEENS